MAKGYSIQEFITGGGDAGTSTGYSLVDPDGNAVAELVPQYDDYGIIGYGARIAGSGDSGSDSVVPVDLDAINARAEKGNIPFGTGMGPALGYEYGMKNSEGDIFRKFDKNGNLTEYLDQHGVFQKASDFKPTGLQFNPMTGSLETTYSSPNSPRANITESNATSINPYHEDQGGWLGEGGWKNIGMLALTGLTAGLGAAGGVGLAGAAGANVAESAAAINALINGGSTLGNALQIGNQLVNIGTTAYDFLKDSNPETAYVIEQLQTETKKNEDAGMSRDEAVETAMGTIAETTPPPANKLPNPPPPPGPPAGAYWLNQSTGTAPDTVFKKSEPGPMYKPSERRDPPPAVFVPPPGPIEPPVNEYIASGEYARNSQPKIYGAPGQDTSSFTPTFTDPVKENVSDADLENLLIDLGGTTGTGVVDTGVVDTGVVDTGVVDTGVVDTGTDASVVDTGVVDTGVDTGTDDTEIIPVLPDTGTEEEEEDDEEKRRKSSDALYQMATATVKTPPPAEIDYFYDIGGDSVFATPKQESLMPSPFEEAPEAVEGAMPRYQYYDPMGGYQYADGGFIENEYTIDDLYRILGSK